MLTSNSHGQISKPNVTLKFHIFQTQIPNTLAKI